MVLSALAFIEMTCEVGLAKLDLENLKRENPKTQNYARNPTKNPKTCKSNK